MGRIPEVIPIEGIGPQPDVIVGGNKTGHNTGNTRGSVYLHRGKTKNAAEKKLWSLLLLRVKTHHLTPEIKLLR